MKFNEFEECNSKFNITPVMERLTSLLNLRYGCNLHFRPLANLADSEKDHLCSRQPNSGIHRTEDRIYLPITLNTDFVGILDIQDSPLMTSDILNSMRDVISVLIEAVYSAANKIEELRVLEDQLTPKTLSFNHNSKNVVSMLNYKDKFKYKDQIKANIQKNPKNFTGSHTLKTSCLLECQSADDILRMALEIHEQSDCFAFISFHQLEDEVRVCKTSLASLGNITLFVPNIVNLRDTEIFALMHFLKESRQVGEPHIVAGSTLPIRKLQEQLILPTEFLQLLNSSFFRIEGSFCDYKKEGIVQHFIENLKKSWVVINQNS